MKVREIRDILDRLREEKYRLQAELEDNGGEVTESVLSREEAIASLKQLLLSKDGVDSLGRFMRSNQDEVQGYKDEKKHLDTLIKKTEGYNDFLLGLIDEILKECEVENAKGNLGYSFTTHTSVTTSVDTKMLRERFLKRAQEAVLEAGIPSDITISLSASISKVSEGSEIPEWYNVSSVGRATFRKPQRAKDEQKEEFNFNTFES